MYQSIKSLSAIAAAVASVVIGGWRGAIQSRLWGAIKECAMAFIILCAGIILWEMYRIYPDGVVMMLKVAGLAYLAFCALVGFLIVTTTLVDQLCERIRRGRQ